MVDRMQPQNITSATYALTAESNHGTTITANRAAGITFTLPAALGYGTEFDIYVGTTITSNNLIIQVANSTDIMSGEQIVAQDGGDTAVIFETAADSDTITMNGSTKGGIKGDRINLKSVSTGIWAVRIISSGTGTEATCFSAAV